MIDIETQDDQPQLVIDTPEQSGEHPKWEYPERREPKWGEITKQGLIIGRGANKKVVPPDDVYKLAVIGCNNQEIADWFGIAEATLRYNFKDFLSQARAELKTKLRRTQIRVALDGHPTMLIWLGKQYLDQRENPVSGEDNMPLPWNESEE